MADRLIVLDIFIFLKEREMLGTTEIAGAGALAINWCLVVFILYVIVCVCYGIVRWRERPVEECCCGKLLRLVVDIVLCPVQLLIKALKKK